MTLTPMMRSLLRTLAAALLAPIAARAQPAIPAGGWVVGGTARAAYVADSAGSATSAVGASLALRLRDAGGPPPQGFAVVSTWLPADTLRGRRVRVSGEIRTSAAAGASLWLRVDGRDGMLFIDNGEDDALRGTLDWTAREIIATVPQGGERMVYGLMLRGGTSAEVRGLRVEALPAVVADAPMAPEARAVLDSAIALARSLALWRDTVTWSVVEPEVRALAAGAQRARDVYPAIRLLLARLGDRHSFLQPPRVAADWQAGRVQIPEPEVRGLPEGIGYVLVPAYGGGDPAAIRTYTQQMHASLAKVATSATCGWVVDLRRNGGGNMYPMLAGLRPFLGAGVIGSFYLVRPSGGPTMSPWFAGQGVGVAPPAGLDSLEHAYVAVLTGPRTASSGEVVTVAFRGRPNTRSFGAATAGFTTGNARFLLPDGSAMLLTTSVYVDRTGTRYGGVVVPDEVIPGAVADAESKPEDDDTLRAATAWLQRTSGCRTTP